MASPLPPSLGRPAAAAAQSAVPVVSGVDTTVGFTAGGTVVDITGSGFTGATRVSFGMVAVNPPYFRVNSDTLVTAMSPAHPAGVVDITVTSGGSAPVTSQTTSADTFRYSDEGWVTGPPMSSARADQTATLLDGPECHQGPPPAYCGRVLVAGGQDAAGHVLDTGEVFDPAANGGAGTWSVVPGHMSSPRMLAAAAALPGGRVLVTGGTTGTTNVATTDIYDAATNSWTVAPPMASARALHTATALADGRVLVVGGLDRDNNGLSTTELFDPVTGAWTDGAPLPDPGRYDHSAVLVNGQVLVAGGLAPGPGPTYSGSPAPVAAATLYQPAPPPSAGSWTSAGSLAAPGLTPVSGSALAVVDGTSCAAATPAPASCGEVIMPGGVSATGDSSQVALFDVATTTWTAGPPLVTARAGATATTLPTGMVLVVGGAGASGQVPAPESAQVYDPGANAWRSTYRPMSVGRSGHTATALADGRVLVTGGAGTSSAGNGNLASTEVYSPSLTTPPRPQPVIATVTPSYGPTTGDTVTLTGTALFPATAVDVGGSAGRIIANTDTMATVVTPPHDPADNVTMTLSVAPDRTAIGYFTYYQGKWLPTAGAPAAARVEQQAVLLDPPGCHDGTLSAPAYPCGDVLVAGGDVKHPGSAELYDPGQDGWSPAATMNVERAGADTTPRSNGAPINRNVFTLTLLRDGSVLAVGGCCDHGGAWDTYERYDPTVMDSPTVRGRWTLNNVTVNHTNVSLEFHSATLLSDGRVLVAGGYYSDRMAEIYDPTKPVGSEWTATPLMHTHRYQQTASLLPGGDVLLAGGVGHPVPTSGPDCSHISDTCENPLATTEIFDPTGGGGAGSWTLGPNLNFAHFLHTATTLDRHDCHEPGGPGGYPCGRILVAGGAGTNSEFYDPAGTPVPAWTSTGAMQEARTNYSATLLPDGRVLATGSVDPFGVSQPPTDATAEIYDPLRGQWIRTADMVTVSGFYHSATLLEGPACRTGGAPPTYCGQVLAVGRRTDAAGDGPASDLYTPVPVVSGLDSNSGPSAGGAAVVIHGYGFTRATAVSFGGVPATSVTVDSTTQVTAVSPAHAGAGTIEVVLSNIGGTSTTIPPNPAARYTYDGPCTSSPGTGQVGYPAGYSIIGLPGGTSVPAQSPLYSWFNVGNGHAYHADDPATTTTVAGHGYWAWFSCPRVVTPGTGHSSLTLPLGADHASMVGNPSGTAAATVSGYDFAAHWDQSLNGGAGGYSISGYRQPQTLGVGAGMWVFSYVDTTVTIHAG